MLGVALELQESYKNSATFWYTSHLLSPTVNILRYHSAFATTNEPTSVPFC